MESKKLTKSERKMNKKISRSRQLLLKHEKIETTEEVSNMLCVYNGGLIMGNSQEKIQDLFNPHGTIQDITMVPEKPYCFVCFERQVDAEKAQSILNGFSFMNGETEYKLCIFYVSQVPPSIGPTTALPPGLILIPDFIPETLEQELLESIDWSTGVDQGNVSLKHRKVKHYGYEFRYDINNVDPSCPLNEGIPSRCLKLLHQVNDLGIVNFIPDQLTVNQYQPGQGIPSHIDTREAFEDGLMSLSLGSQVVMEFRHPKGDHLSVLIPPRSLLIMTSDSRYVWSHGITPRKSDIIPASDGKFTLSQRGIRTSFTFRKLTENAGIYMNNNQPVQDKKEKKAVFSLPRNDEDAVKLEQQHVHQVYEEIADHFSSTRHSPWPQIVQFINSQPPGSIMADIGCGNGKYLGINENVYSIGSDRSYNLASICRFRNFQSLVSDVMCIPLRPDSFDVCICIAVIHHLSTWERRLGAIQELVRILRPGGQVLIYVWALEQQRHKEKSKYLKQDKNKLDSNENSEVENEYSANNMQINSQDSANNMQINSQDSDTGSSKNIGIHVNRTEFQEQDMFVPWQLKNKSVKNAATFHRFYHVFREGELEDLCEKISDCRIIKSYYDQGNWCIILQKL
ncbi:hypothetical protein LOTGIDRAFT_143038 [Lottia gigantea]|uniref:tRNA (carboxymethyluridine(34)-5-O)-methyltransferase n=1 Tax=Lottia gigantea TaxID=225164 RepID=V4ATA6_LOTGI|nr:hypothetical protein LOTGIDRAFT_143038 [Lottia gigantea]ESO98125.1 hypothetical protein LOTGIDRAFT_143038 [Lottia gigantea]